MPVTLITAALLAQTGQSPPLPRVTEHVIVTATAAPIPSASLGRVVTVITGEDLQRLGFTAIAEALRLVPGLDARARGPHDVQTDFSIRGATFGQQLVLVDGLRLNDSQSGHHNGDIPIPIVGLDRIEILHGAGSAIHGADALGGTIHLITRRDRHAVVRATAGQHGLATSQASLSGRWIPDRWTVTAWGSRSGGFTFDRDFALGGVSARGEVGAGWTIDVRHQRKAFGANGFYGASPSKEWTDQTIAAATWRRATGPWLVQATGLLRDHGDHFRWDINRPGFAENRHRTHAVAADVKIQRGVGGGRTLTFGGGAGGDWVRSSNLGDHDYRREHVFAELQLPIGPRSVITTGARFDDYSTFGRSWSPSVSASTWVTPAVRLRASAARAFRVPTFTELYYHDPANLGRPDLVAERGWSVDGGVDWVRGGWTIAVSPFGRWDDNVIDWVRASPTDLWRSNNVRDVTSRGVESSVTGRWSDAFVRLHYTRLEVDAPSLDQLSKYVLEYARHSAGASIAAPIGAGVRLAVTVDHRRRFGGQSYVLAAAKLARAFGRAELSLEGTNLLNETYIEVLGVAMPGRWLMVGVLIR